MSYIAWINIGSVFVLGAAYSFFELMSFFNTARNFWSNIWGPIYIILNGLFSIVALVLTFESEINEQFLGLKVIVAGTSALALLRVVIIPVKNGMVGNNVMPLIDIVLNHVKRAYDRKRSKLDLNDIKEIMHGIDYKCAAESLPILCSNLLRTLSEEDGKKMNEEIGIFLTVEEARNEIKAINLGIILQKYIGIELLKSTVDGIREFIAVDAGEAVGSPEHDDLEDLNDLIEKFS